MDFNTLVERMHEASAVAGVDTMRKIEEAHARVALDLLGVPDGWPEGWVMVNESAMRLAGEMGPDDRGVDVYELPDRRHYALIDSPNYATSAEALESGRRAIWAMMGRGVTSIANQPATIDREALAAALHDAYVADATIVWGERCEDVRQGYRREADTAIRLCAGADAGARIADLEARIANLTATANAAVERAEAAEFRAARAEKALRLSADAAEAATTDEEDARQELYDARAENDRLRRALAVALSGAKHMATVAALLTGEADDA